MSNEHGPAHGVMEGKGAYNRHAALPAGGAALALPLLERAIRDVEIDSGSQPIVIADYGSSQGKNSQAPMQIAVRGLRKRIGPNRAISVFHIDQPSNDFNSLFEVLHADPNSYVVDEPDVYPAAIGKSFYEKVLPAGSVHLGWSSYAAVWLSRVPTLIPGHFISVRSTGTVRAEFERQAARDWEAFLALRARELRPGGRLIVVLPGIADDGLSGFELIFDQANAVLEEMVADGTITSEERSRMAVGGHPRRKRDLLAPFERNGKFQQLNVEDFAMSEVRDAVWEQYDRDGDKGALATKHALFFRSIFVPSLACALSPARDTNGEVHGAFADQLEQRLKRRLASRPLEMLSFVQTLLLAKSNPRPSRIVVSRDGKYIKHWITRGNMQAELSTPVAVPRSRLHLRVVWLCGLVLFLEGYDIAAVGYAIPSLVDAWKVQPAVFTQVLTAGNVGLLLGSVCAGLLGDRLGRKPVLIICVVAFGVFSLLAALAGAPPQLAGLRFLTGLGLGGGLPPELRSHPISFLDIALGAS